MNTPNRDSPVKRTCSQDLAFWSCWFTQLGLATLWAGVKLGHLANLYKVNTTPIKLFLTLCSGIRVPVTLNTTWRCWWAKDFLLACITKYRFSQDPDPALLAVVPIFLNCKCSRNHTLQYIAKNLQFPLGGLHFRRYKLPHPLPFVIDEFCASYDGLTYR